MSGRGLLVTEALNCGLMVVWLKEDVFDIGLVMAMDEVNTVAVSGSPRK